MNACIKAVESAFSVKLFAPLSQELAKNLSHDARIDEQSKTYKTTWMQNRYPVEVTWTERQHVQFP